MPVSSTLVTLTVTSMKALSSDGSVAVTLTE